MINEVVRLKISSDRMEAWLEILNVALINELDSSDLHTFLKEEKLETRLFCFDEQQWKTQLTETGKITVSKGIPHENGKDGYIEWFVQLEEILEEKEKTSFRDIKKIPTINKDMEIGMLIHPTAGKSGLDVYGNKIKSKPGKKVITKAGRNVGFDDKKNTFVSQIDGKLSISDKLIQVFDTYEWNEDLSLETGNIDFIGSVYIKGNVPTGYTVKANGDIHIIGLVEGAKLKAGGNIIISNGISGMDKAIIQADGDVIVNYINQASVEAGNNLIVTKSILHSQCVAEESILCENGSIIGGSCSAGHKIIVKHIGNLSNSKTEISLGINKRKREELEQFQKELTTYEINKNKLLVLGKQLQEKNNLTTNERIMLLKQRKMLEVTEQNLQKCEKAIEELQISIGNYQDLDVIVNGTMYDNVELNFGKYSRVLNREYKYIKASLKEKEIVIESLK
ncbi:DUF342 domain-containing protein [Gracilibacillus marinus]|uniref:DUF342 domain-containing protein n=1 Tax=Gracilibacillus marinus TaxID=630535 RepID=A0ABV8VUP8_9BACI